MEHRLDLETILLNGLPEHERIHVVKIMRQVTVGKIRRLRTEGIRDNDPIDLTDSNEYEQEFS
jgi:hypothetical protein